MGRDFIPRTVPHQPRVPPFRTVCPLRRRRDARRSRYFKKWVARAGYVVRAGASDKPCAAIRLASRGEPLTPRAGSPQRGWIRRGEHSRRAAAAAGRASPQVFTPQAAVPFVPGTFYFPQIWRSFFFAFPDTFYFLCPSCREPDRCQSASFSSRFLRRKPATSWVELNLLFKRRIGSSSASRKICFERPDIPSLADILFLI